MVEINLLSWREELRCRQLGILKKQLLSVITAVLVVLLLWHIILGQQCVAIMKQIKVLQGKEKLITVKAQTISIDLPQLQQSSQRTINKAADLEKQQTKLIQFFTRLPQGMAHNLYLTQLLIKNQEIQLIGMTESMYGITQLVKNFLPEQVTGKQLLQKILKKDEGYEFILSFSRFK